MVKSKKITQAVVPGPVVLFGSGETSPSGRKVFDFVMRSLPESPQVALLETPAGFELNSDRVHRSGRRVYRTAPAKLSPTGKNCPSQDARNAF